MKLPALLASDLHLVESPSTEYRWGLFPWLQKTIKAERVRTLNILGDLTDAKDNHSAALVNRVVDAVKMLPRDVDVRILAGNHDWLKAGEEFFRFLSVLPNVRFIVNPWEDDDTSAGATASAFYLPYSKSPVTDWKGMDFSHYQVLFVHQTVGGSVSSNGERMAGEALPPLNAARVYSGDIHVPQVVDTPAGRVEYVGSPYHVHFGDAFKPRCVLLDRNLKAHDLAFQTISRVTVKVPGLAELRRMAFREGDQVKLRLELGPEERHDWLRVRREAVAWLRKQGAEVHGVELVAAGGPRRWDAGAIAATTRAPALSAGDAVTKFVEDEGLGGSALDVGLEIAEGAK